MGNRDNDLAFDRCQFDPAFRASGRYAEDRMIAMLEGLRIGDAEEDIDDSDRDFDFLARKIKAEGLPESAKIREAVEKGEVWAKNASPENILRLPKKQCLAVIWHFWGGLSYSECGSTMCLNRHAVLMLIQRAKKKLSGMTVTT